MVPSSWCGVALGAGAVAAGGGCGVVPGGGCCGVVPGGGCCGVVPGTGTVADAGGGCGAALAHLRAGLAGGLTA